MTSPASVTSSSRGLADNLIPRTRFGKYTLIAKIGHGGMAEVFLAALSGPAGFTKLTVIKRLHPHLDDEPQLIGMFLDEARLAARLNHPQVVQTYEIGDVDGRHFLAMEYLEGQSFARLLKYAMRQGETLPMPIAVRIFIDALDGLHYAHSLTDFDGTPLGVVHRDISPGNLFLTYDGQVKLLDFGIAKAGTQMMETRAGQVKGKFAYIAPEQARPGHHDHRADIWSMGVVFWETFAGRRLFKGETEITTLQNALNSDVPRLDSVVDVPTELADIADRALQRNAEDRFESAEEMKAALEDFMVKSGFRVSRNEVGQCLAGYFTKERVEQRKVLQAFMAGELVDNVTASVAPEASSGITGVRALTGSGVTPAKKKGPSKKWVIALLLGACVIGGMAAVVVPKLLGTGDTEGTLEREGAGVANATGTETGATETETAATETGTGTDTTGTGTAGTDTAGTGTTGTDTTGTETGTVGTETVGTETGTEAGIVNDEPIGETTTPTRMTRRTRMARMTRMQTAQASAMEPTMETVAPMMETPMVAAESGTLTLASTPWSHVSLGGRRIGTTPLVNHRLPVGTHTLTLTNPERGLRTTYRVTIRAGQRTVRRIGLE